MQLGCWCRCSAEQEAVATDAMFDLLDRFLVDRSPRDGLLDIHVRFRAACDELDGQLSAAANA